MLIGFLIAAPVGPIGLLVIRRTLAEGRVTGFFSGLGAASADAVYGCVAAFGLTSISGFLIGQQSWLRLVGGAFLLYLGLRTLYRQPDGSEAAPVNEANVELAGAYASTFFLTLTNPSTILSFAAVFAGLGLVEEDSGYASATLLVAGVFGGSALWWLLLSGGVSLLRRRLGPRALSWVNRVSGAILFGFGVVALLSAARGV